MSALTGSLGLADADVDFVNDIGHGVIFEHINSVLARYNTEIANLFNVFVAGQTVKDTLRYYLPIGGMSQPLTEFAPAAGVGRTGSYDCAFPLRGWGDGLDISRWGWGYTSVQALGAQLDSLMHRNISRKRHRILTAIFEDTNLAWLDPTQQNAALTIRRLANTDGTLYPPVLGSDTEAQDDHYAETAYTIIQITDANNPLITLRDEVLEHFGGRTSGGENFLVLMNADAEPYIRLLTDFVAVLDEDIDWGADTDKARMLANVPGRIIGKSNGVWCSVYAEIPATYMIGVHLDHPPLLERIDTAKSGLPHGYNLVAVDVDHPLTSSQYETRYGVAAGNRLSADVLEISGGAGVYEPPAEFAE